MRIHVDPVSPSPTDPAPGRFVLGDQTLEVEEILDQWYGPADTWYRVRASDGGLYILQHSPGQEPPWTLASYRREQ